MNSGNVVGIRGMTQHPLDDFRPDAQHGKAAGEGAPQVMQPPVGYRLTQFLRHVLV
ncbi:hypothetical protein D9M68_901470 [compost metagenome]